MKRAVILFVILFLIISNRAFSQKYSFGAKFTPIASWCVPTNTNNFNYLNDKLKLGIGFGPSLKINMSNSFNTDIGLLFVWQGTSFNQINTVDSLAAMSYNFDTKIQYVQIPVIFEGKFNVSRKLEVAIDFGVIPAVKLSSVADVTDNLTNAVLDTDLEIPTTFFNLFLSAGAGTVFHIADGVSVSSIVLYNNGVFDVWFDKNSDPYIKSLDMKNHYISLNLGIHIDF